MTELIEQLLNTPNDDYHEVLSQIQSWKWPRSDLNAWIKVLNKFDVILEETIRDYDIDNLQVNVFTPRTKKTVCEILRFERLLLENSTNRKTFNSYDVCILYLRPVDYSHLSTLTAPEQSHVLIRLRCLDTRTQLALAPRAAVLLPARGVPRP